MESVIPVSDIVFVVRSRWPFTRRPPSRGLLGATLAVGLTLLLPLYATARAVVPLPPLSWRTCCALSPDISLRLSSKESVLPAGHVLMSAGVAMAFDTH